MKMKPSINPRSNGSTLLTTSGQDISKAKFCEALRSFSEEGRRRTKLFAALLLITILLPLGLFAQDDKSDWYPFVIPEKLDTNSPANIGKLVLDAPAGKHGFLKTKGNQFVFEDGTPMKFWGTNLVFDACFPSKEQAVMMADRLAFFGFNAVRLHHMDFYFEPHGIFKDVWPAYKNPQQKKTGVLSPQQMDKLDYLIYQLKIRGIYIDMNLLVARHFTQADGVKNAAQLGMAAKPASMFDPKLIELQKQYAKDLLTHYNPYTKLKYCDDPAIALVEIINESSIVKDWRNNKLNGSMGGLKKDAIPEYYSKELDNLWQQWLKEKYSASATLQKTWHTSGYTSTQNIPIAIDPLKWTLEKRKTAKGSIENKSNETIIHISEVTSVARDLQYKTTGINLSKDKNYTIKFTAKADKPTKISVVCQQPAPSYKGLGISEQFELDKEFRTVESVFTANAECTNATLAFLVGYDSTNTTIKDISLEETSGIQLPPPAEQEKFIFPRPIYKLKMLYPRENVEDVEEFYDNLEQKYFDQMRDLLKNNLKVKIPVTGNAFSDEKSQKNCDFIDDHDYWDHPRFPHKFWDKNDFIIDNKSTLQDTPLGLIDTIQKSYTSNKPRTVTEWNHCYPSQYAYETPLPFAVQTTQNEINCLFQFAFNGDWKTIPKFDNIISYFDTITNSQQLILLSLGSYLYTQNIKIEAKFANQIYTINSPNLQAAIGFIKDKELRLGDFTITPKENGVVAILKIESPLPDNQNSTKTKSPRSDATLQDLPRRGTHYLITLVSQVKNTNSGWINGKFDWGKAPVLLKRIPTEIKLNKNIKTTAYELMPDGKQGKKIAENSSSQPLLFSTDNVNSPWIEIVTK